MVPAYFLISLDKALSEFKKALKLNPNNPTAKHLICALEQKQTPAASPPEYIMELFDQYANYYTKHVKKNLKYKVPETFRRVAGKFIKTSAARIKSK